MLDEIKRDIEILKKSDRNIAKEIFKLQDRMDTLDDRMTRGFGELRTSLEKFADEIDLSRRERKLKNVTFNSLNEKLTNHELRIVRVERIEGIYET